MSKGLWIWTNEKKYNNNKINLKASASVSQDLNLWLQWISSFTRIEFVIPHLCAVDCGCWWLGSGTGHRLLAHRWGGSRRSHWSTPLWPARAHWTYSEPSLANARQVSREARRGGGWRKKDITVANNCEAFPGLVLPHYTQWLVSLCRSSEPLDPQWAPGPLVGCNDNS